VKSSDLPDVKRFGVALMNKSVEGSHAQPETATKYHDVS